MVEVCNNFRFLDERFEKVTDFVIYIYHYHETGAFKSDLVGLVKLRIDIRSLDDLNITQLILSPMIEAFRRIREEYFFEVKGIQFPEPKLIPEREFNVFYADAHRERFPSFVPVSHGLYDKEPHNVAREESQLYPVGRTSQYAVAEIFKESEELVKPHTTYESKYK